MKCSTNVLAATVAALACVCSVARTTATQADDVSTKKGLTNPFFVLSNGVQDANHQTPQSQAKLLAELGYDGIGPSGVEGIPEMLEALDEHGLKMHALYIGTDLDPGKPKYDPRLKDVIKCLKGRETIIWLYILRGPHAPSSTGGDDRAVEIVREVAEMAGESGLRVALYPHVGFYVARVEDAVRVAEKVDRKNVGVTFNLCHWLKLDEVKSMLPLMKLAMPRLLVVTINGADPEEGWDRVIQTLDRGSFDTYEFLKTLRQLGYTGPIGLQCYGIKGDARENLTRSMAAWRKLSARIAAEGD